MLIDGRFFDELAEGFHDSGFYQRKVRAWHRKAVDLPTILCSPPSVVDRGTIRACPSGNSHEMDTSHCRMQEGEHGQLAQKLHSTRIAGLHGLGTAFADEKGL
ncbi:MAG: hypothetical protein ACI8T1_004489 [Verrucomicrobiales bacterium]